MLQWTQDREIVICEELTFAVLLIEQGLTAFERNEGKLIPYFLLLLSNGFERLLKVIICLSCFAQKPNNPDFGDIQTHDVNTLLRRAIEAAQTGGYENQSAQSHKDLEFLKNDKDLQKLVKLMTEFADKGGRYYNLDFIIGEECRHIDYNSLFDYYCHEIDKQVQDPINHVMNILKQLAGALSRTLQSGCFGKMGQDIGNPSKCAILDEMLTWGSG